MALLPELRRNWTLKLIALILAILLWAVVKGDEPTRLSIANVPVEVVLNDEDWVLLEGPEPATVRVVFTGPVRELVRLGADRPRILLPVERVQDSVEVRAVGSGRIAFTGEFQRTTVAEVQPATVRLTFDRSASRDVPVAITIQGELPQGYALRGPVVADPPTVRVSGARRYVERITSLRLHPIDLSRFAEPASPAVAVDTAGLGVPVVISPLQVTVYLPVVRVDSLEADSVPLAGLTRVPARER